MEIDSNTNINKTKAENWPPVTTSEAHLVKSPDYKLIKDACWRASNYIFDRGNWDSCLSFLVK